MILWPKWNCESLSVAKMDLMNHYKHHLGHLEAGLNDIHTHLRFSGFFSIKWPKIESFKNVSLNVQTLKQDLGQTKRDMSFNP